VLLTINMAIWGSSLVIARAAHEMVPPVALTFWRWVVAIVVLLPLVWRELPGSLTYLRQNRCRLLIICEYMVVGTTFSVISVNYTTAINASLINGSQPIATAFVAFLVIRERLSLVAGLGILIAFSGVLVMISQGSLEVIFALAFNIGDLVMLVAVVAWALYAVELHRQREHLSGTVFLFYIAVTGMITVFPFYITETLFIREFVPSWNGVAAIVYVSLFATVIAVYLWNFAIRSVGATHASIFLNLIPVFGAAFAMYFLGEDLYVFHIIGTSLVFAGIVMTVRARLRTT